MYELYIKNRSDLDLVILLSMYYIYVYIICSVTANHRIVIN